jgi:hypothetical protein
MEKRLKFDGLIRDDKAVALTEFCIVIPVVLFFFLAVLQYFEFVRAAQMVNYAAYVAARSYAVLHSEDKAQDSAVMALAPISNNLGLGSLPGDLGGAMSGISSFFGNLAEAIPGGQAAASYANGLISAYASLSFGNFTVTTNTVTGTSLQQVYVSINYPQFINIPCFESLWKLMTGNDPFASLEYYYQNYSWSSGLASVDLPVALFLAEGCINVPGKCSTGYESWGSTTAFNQAYNQVSRYNTIYPASSWWKGTSGSWQPRTAAQPQ